MEKKEKGIGGGGPQGREKDWEANVLIVVGWQRFSKRKETIVVSGD